jgi:hypothetical protein
MWKCGKCHLQLDLPSRLCPHDDAHETDIPSNVWLAGDDEPDLEKRFQSITELLYQSPSLRARLDKYSELLRANLTISLNLQPEALFNIIFNPGVRITNLHDNLKAQVVQNYDKRLASKRRGIDALAFDYDGERLNFGAVNLDGQVGLVSYGSACLILNSAEIKCRVSFLENNAFSYYSASGAGKDFHIPRGARALWHTLEKLLMIKHVKELFGTNELTLEEISNVVLRSTGDKSTDQFIEAQIFPPILGGTISKIVLSMKNWRKVNNISLVGKTAQHMQDLLYQQGFEDHMRGAVQRNLPGVELKVVDIPLDD